MTEARPRIGIVGAARTEFEQKAFQAYVDAIENAGGTPVPIQPGAGEGVLDQVDGLVLTGGRDVDPKEYGQTADPAMAVEVDAQRDALELPLVREAVRRDLPMLAICRGVQVLNVVLGGTLIQDLDVQRTGRQTWSHQQRKSRPEASPDATIHHVEVAPGSRLRDIAGADRLGVNTFHHQAIAEVAPGLVVTARAVEPDTSELIEAVEAPGCRWVLGVQWHPERMWRTGPAHRRLFVELVQAARGVRVG
ncbi:MAG TPA: gamma-glutamyl-gamma-aminobutyrate hydrolase family protein [bacterium]|nr:gamma-glutamyl-gamma-aminobutyrate hydrolase family protein [bacterium]